MGKDPLQLSKCASSVTTSPATSLKLLTSLTAL